MSRIARYSKQREVINEILKNTTAHPSAAEVYEKAREVMPHISLGTVYRNLELLSHDGEAQIIQAGEAFHFDGNAAPHPHFHCTCCGRVSDLEGDFNKLLKAVHGLENHSVQNAVILFSGICPKCS